MSPKAIKFANTFATVLFILGGITCLGLAGVVTIKPAPPKQAQYVGRKVDAVGCEALLKKLEFTVPPVKNKLIQASYPSLSNPKELLDKATLGIAACQMPLKSFCMGTGCPTSGLSFSLDATDKK